MTDSLPECVGWKKPERFSAQDDAESGHKQCVVFLQPKGQKGQETAAGHLDGECFDK